jgi:transcriptional regulator with XRE-family HTH domain
MTLSATDNINPELLRQLVLAQVKNDVRISKHSTSQTDVLYNKLVDLLLEGHERIAEFGVMTATTLVILHSGTTLKNGQKCHLAKYPDDDGGEIEVLQIAMDADNLWRAMKQALSNVAKPDQNKIVTGHQLMLGSGLISDDGTTSSGMQRGRGGSVDDYDIQGELRTGKAHTSGQQNREAHRRIGLEFEDASRRERKAAFAWMQKTGARWQQAEVDEEPSPIHTETHQARRRLWQDRLDYLLSDEALQSKNPARWFRDICVVCGVSTPMLAEHTGEGDTAIWSKRHNTSTPYRRPELDALRVALSIHLSTPIKAGYGRNTGRGIGYYIPTGSAFGLPVITDKVDGKEKVDPDAVEDVLKKLFVERIVGDDEKEVLINHYRPTLEPTHTLRQLKQLSDAWRQGKLTREEVIAASPIKGNSKLKQIVQYYGISYLYSAVSTEYKQLLNALHQVDLNITSLCATLGELNKDKWHIPKPEFDEIMKSLSWLPASEIHLFKTDDKHSASEAWEFAKLHHDGTIGGFLNTYRDAHGDSQQELADRLGIEREVVSQYARGVVRKQTAINRALSIYHKNEKDENGNITHRKDESRMITVDGVEQLENMWQLPTDPSDPNKIRADVVTYLEHWKSLLKEEKSPNIPNPEIHWVNVMDVLDDFADTPATAHLDMADFRKYPVLGQWTESLRNPQEHPVLGAVQEALAPYAGEPLPLIKLGDQEYLVKHTEHGEVMFQQSDLERLRPWLCEQVEHATTHARQARSAPAR